MALAVGCSSPAQSIPGDAVAAVFASCVPTSSRLDPDSTLAAHAGSYRLTLVRRADARDIASVRGALVLYRQVTELEALGNASTPLYGMADVTLKAVGARVAGDIESDDPAAPGVLALEVDRAGGRNILLRLGSVANRRDAMLYDGAYTVLEVKEISADGFRGIWRSGAPSSRASGYFCATRS